MKKLVAVLLVLGFGSVSAFGGLVEFNPGKADVLSGDAAIFDLTIVSDLAGGIDSADVVIGSDLPMTWVSYDPAWDAAFANTFAVGPIGIYAIDLFVSSNNPTLVGTPIALGTISVDTTGTMVGERYNVWVDVGVDGFSGVGGAGVFDGLTGAGEINIVPEPATLGLLGLGALGLLRRRK